MGRIIDGRFAILEQLGSGSMATVYRARQEAMGRDVALKIVRSDRLIDPQAKGRFEQEARATSRLTSRHTVTVFDFGEITIDGDDPEQLDGSLFLVMELLDGESLADRLKRVGKLEPDAAVRIVRHALRSLVEAHAKGVIHRDLKPDNLILTRAADTKREICKVLDFGIAKLMGTGADVDALETQAGTVFGTPRYMSPEQAQGKQLDARSDLYSLGVILYHMLAGRPPYTDNDAVVVMAHHIKTKPKRLSLACPDASLPENLEHLVSRLLAKDPAGRPQSAAELLAEIERLGDLEPGRGGVSGELTAVVGRVLGSTRVSFRVGLLAVVALASAVWLAVALGGDEQLDRPAVAALGPASRHLARQATAAAVPAPEALPDSDQAATGAARAAAASSGSAGPRPVTPPRSRPRRPRSYRRFDR